MADSKLTALAAITPSADDLIYVVDDPAGTPVSKKATIASVRKVVQVVNTMNGALGTGTTTTPMDDTIPQITEGTEFMTLAITPTSATNALKIEVVFCGGVNSTTLWCIVALHQDAIANALAAGPVYNAQTGTITPVCFTHYMTSGTTSATTFRIRAGGSGASTVTFNGAAGARYLGGVMASSITITEIVP